MLSPSKPAQTLEQAPKWFPGGGDKWLRKLTGVAAPSPGSRLPFRRASLTLRHVPLPSDLLRSGVESSLGIHRKLPFLESQGTGCLCSESALVFICEDLRLRALPGPGGSGVCVGGGMGGGMADLSFESSGMKMSNDPTSRAQTQ